MLKKILLFSVLTVGLVAVGTVQTVKAEISGAVDGYFQLGSTTEEDAAGVKTTTGDTGFIGDGYIYASGSIPINAPYFSGALSGLSGKYGLGVYVNYDGTAVNDSDIKAGFGNQYFDIFFGYQKALGGLLPAGASTAGGFSVGKIYAPSDVGDPLGRKNSLGISLTPVSGLAIKLAFAYSNKDLTTGTKAKDNELGVGAKIAYTFSGATLAVDAAIATTDKSVATAAKTSNLSIRAGAAYDFASILEYPVNVWGIFALKTVSVDSGSGLNATSDGSIGGEIGVSADFDVVDIGVLGSFAQFAKPKGAATGYKAGNNLFLGVYADYNLSSDSTLYATFALSTQQNKDSVTTDASALYEGVAQTKFSDNGFQVGFQQSF